MTAPLGCPGTEGWQSLLELDLAPDQLSRWERHLQLCPACQDRLDRAAADEEEFRERARRVGDPTAAPIDPTLSEFLERLQEGKDLAPALPTEPIELSYLRPSDRPDLLGTLGVYEVREVIGEGGMGVVLKAYEPALQRLVAIKVLAPALARSATARRRFTREAQAAATVSHEHIVPIHDVHESDGLPYLVMQYVAGESLQARLDRNGPPDVVTIVGIGQQTALGLAAAHARGLIHRDIKPANILLEGERGAPDPGALCIKIIDFGLARLVDEVGLTQNGVVAGTPEYMAPEQARGEPVDHRADLFSLGSVLYALCTGVPPFRAATPMAVLRQVSDAAPRPVRSLNPEVPAWLEALITRLLAKDPAERYQSAAEVAGLLEGYLAHLRQPGTVPPPELPPLPAEACAGPPSSRFRGRLATWLRPRRLAALGTLAVLGGGLFLLLQAAPPPQKQPSATDVSCDFRGGRPLPSSFTLEGPDAKEVVKQEEEGLRITLPATRKSGAPVGVATTFPVAGDFEITGTYEFLSADRPPGGNGVGVALNIATDHDLTKFGKVSRFLRAQEGDVYQTEFWIKGQPDSGEHTFTPTTARAGKLRFVREGSTLRFLVADGPGNEFEEINRREFTTEDLGLCRFVVNNSGSPAGVDVRLIDLQVRSWPASPPSILPKPKRWMLAVGALGLILGLLCALGVLLHVRRRTPTVSSPGVPGTGEGGEEKPGPAAPEAAAPFIVFPCPGCGKNLRARAALAGKSLKCPRCGQAVRAPGSQEENPGGAKRSLRCLWLVALAALTTLGLGLWPFGAGGANGKPGELKPGELKEVLFHDFRHPPTPPSFSFWREPEGKFLKAEPEGVRITTPATYIHPFGGIGYLIEQPFDGDFEATATVEVLHADRPAGYGVGVLLAVNTGDAADGEWASLSRQTRARSGEVLYCCRSQDGAFEGDEVPCTDRVGKLRLKRTGTTVSYLWAPGLKGEAFRTLHEYELGPEPIKSVRLTAVTGRQPCQVDVRLIDVQIRSGPASPASRAWTLGRKGSLVVALGFILGLLSVLGVLLHTRRRARIVRSPGVPVTREGGEEKPGPAAPEAAVLFIAFPCPGCAKNLRARAALAGKSLKCPRCGQAVHAPGAQADGSIAKS